MSDVVVIKTENGPVRIDSSEYNPDVHTLHQADDTYDENGVMRVTNIPVIEEQTAVIDDNKPVVQTFGVMQKKKRFYAIDTATGEQLTMDGIDPNGYETNKLAWEAVLAITNK